MNLTIVFPNLGKRTLVVNEASLKRGAECDFYKIDKRKGIKIYEKKERAILTRDNQIAYWRQGLAPKILSVVFVVKGYYGDDCYGYFTQIAATRGITLQESDTFFKMLRETNVQPKFIDNQLRNVGRINGKIVAIDVGMGVSL